MKLVLAFILILLSSNVNSLELQFDAHTYLKLPEPEKIIHEGQVLLLLYPEHHISHELVKSHSYHFIETNIEGIEIEYFSCLILDECHSLDFDQDLLKKAQSDKELFGANNENFYRIKKFGAFAGYNYEQTVGFLFVKSDKGLHQIVFNGEFNKFLSFFDLG